MELKFSLYGVKITLNIHIKYCEGVKYMGAVKIYSIQANSLWMVNRNDEGAFLDIKNAYLNESPFLKYMKKHGLTVYQQRKRDRTRDIILLKFDYGVKAKEAYVKKSAAEIRRVYYKNGVDVTWNKYDKHTGKVVSSETVHYKMLMRSSGKAKKGECYFIKSDLLDVARKYLTMDLYEKMPEENAPLVEMSAYSTMTTATAMDYINIPLKNILIIRDKTVETEVPVAIVQSRDVKHIKKVIDFSAMEDILNEQGYTFCKTKQKNNPELEVVKRSKKALEECDINPKDYVFKNKEVTQKECAVIRSDNGKVENILWDGMGLIDESIFPSDKKMDGFIYCRSHFFKSCLFRGNVVQFLSDYYKDKYNTATVEDMFGNKVKVKDIRVIITDKSIKWIKFTHLMGETDKEAYEYYKKVMKKYNNEFAIVKTAHSSKWGELQRSSYQINNSLPCVDEEVLQKLAQKSIEYCNGLKTDHKKLIEHLERVSQSYGVEKVWIALDKINIDFKNTQYFKTRRNSLISKFKNDRLMLGKLLYVGDNLTACGNPLALLKTVVEKDGWREENCFHASKDYIECYTEKFSDGEMLAGFRSPHNSPNNILSFKNVYSEELIKYFPNLGKNVIVVNGIGTDIQARANGCDFDTDAFFVTNQKEMAELAQKAYKIYPTIVNAIPPSTESKQKYNKDAESYAMMDNNISSAQFGIGWSSNIAQLALSYYYDMQARTNSDKEDLKSLEDIFIICSVLAQVAIDSAKRTFDINVNSELRRLGEECVSKRIGKRKYPGFYADNQNKLKDYKIENSEIDDDILCPMQMIYKIMDNSIVDLRKEKSVNTPTYDLHKIFKEQKSRKRDSKQYKKVVSYIKEYDETVKKEDKHSEGYSQNVQMEFDECMNKINKLKINQYTMSSLIQYAFTNSDGICDRMLTILFENNKERFLNCFIHNEKTEKLPTELHKSQ